MSVYISTIEGFLFYLIPNFFIARAVGGQGTKIGFSKCHQMQLSHGDRPTSPYLNCALPVILYENYAVAHLERS